MPSRASCGSHVSEAALAARRKASSPTLREVPAGVLAKYRRLVGSAAEGAVTDG